MRSAQIGIVAWMSDLGWSDQGLTPSLSTPRMGQKLCLWVCSPLPRPLQRHLVPAEPAARPPCAARARDAPGQKAIGSHLCSLRQLSPVLAPLGTQSWRCHPPQPLRLWLLLGDSVRGPQRPPGCQLPTRSSVPTGKSLNCFLGKTKDLGAAGGFGEAGGVRARRDPSPAPAYLAVRFGAAPPAHSFPDGGGGLGRGSAHPTSHVLLAFSPLLYPACSDSGLKRASASLTERRGPCSGQLALRSSLQGWPRSAARGCW